MKTAEPCPVCGIEATCEHGVSLCESYLFIHLWDCPECGESVPMVGYDCPECLEAERLRQLEMVQLPEMEGAK